MNNKKNNDFKITTTLPRIEEFKQEHTTTTSRQKTNAPAPPKTSTLDTSFTQSELMQSAVKTKKPKTNKNDEVMKLWEQRRERERAIREQAEKEELAKRQFFAMSDSNAKAILKKDRSLQNSLMEDVKTMSNDEAIAKLQNDYETKEIQKGYVNAREPKLYLINRGKKLVTSDSELRKTAAKDFTFAEQRGVNSSDSLALIGSIPSGYTRWLVDSNHMATTCIKKLPKEKQANAINTYYALQRVSPNKAIEYVKKISGYTDTSSENFWNDTINLSSTPTEADYADFNLWKTEQEWLAASGNEKDANYYNKRIKDGTLYNNMTMEEDFDSFVKKGREMPWRPSMGYLNLYTYDQLKDKSTIYDYMIEKEKDIYSYILAKHGETQAEDYLAFLADDLEIRRNTIKTQETEDFAKEHPVLSTISTGPISLLSGYESLFNIIDQSLMEFLYSEAYKPNTVVKSKNHLNNYNDTVINTVAAEIDNDTLQILYESGVNVYQFALQLFLSKNLGAIPTTINNAGNNMDDSISRGISKENAINQILIEEAISHTINKYIPTLSHNNLSKSIIQDYASDISEIVVDNIMNGDLSEHNQSLDDYENIINHTNDARLTALFDTFISEPLTKIEYGKLYSSILNDPMTNSANDFYTYITDDEFDDYINKIMNN